VTQSFHLVQYLAKYEIGPVKLSVGQVHFPYLARSGSFYPERWFQSLLRRVDARAMVPGCDVTLRTHLRDQALAITLFFRCPAQHQSALRQYLASYLRLQAIVDEPLVLPKSQEEHDRLAAALPIFQCSIRPGPFRAANCWLACNFRMHGILPQLLEEAAVYGFELFHQINLYKYWLTPALEGVARKNLFALGQLSGAKAALLEAQRHLLGKSSGPATLAEEYVAVRTESELQWLSYALVQRFDRLFGHLNFQMPDFEFVRGDFSDVLAAGFHRALFETLDPYEVYSSIVEPSEEKELFTWDEMIGEWINPSDAPQRAAAESDYQTVEHRFQNEAEQAAKLATTEFGLEVSENSERFVFVSYRRSDFARIVPILKNMKSVGYPIWFDHGIPGSADWNSEIERQLARCQLLLLFVSQQAIDSKYVRREIHYADTMCKPILGVLLENTKLHSGMEMILGMYQMLDVTAPDFATALTKALEYAFAFR
jgi:hypothetical protein